MKKKLLSLILCLLLVITAVPALVFGETEAIMSEEAPAEEAADAPAAEAFEVIAAPEIFTASGQDPEPVQTVNYGTRYDHIDVEIDARYTVSVDGAPVVLTGSLQPDSIKVRVGSTVYDYADYYVSTVSEEGKSEYRISVWGLSPNGIDWVSGTYKMTNVWFSGRMLFADVPDKMKDILPTTVYRRTTYYYIDIEELQYDGVQECTNGNGKRSEDGNGTPSGLDLYIEADGLEIFLTKGKLTIRKIVTDEKGNVIPPLADGTDFTFTLTDANGNPVLFKDGVYSADGTGSAVVTVKNGAAVTLEKLPEGEYTVTEAQIDGYSVYSTDGKNEGNYSLDHVKVTKSDADIPVVSFVNAKLTEGFAVSLKKNASGLPEGSVYPAPVISIVNAFGETVWTGSAAPGSDTEYLTSYLAYGDYTVTESGADVEGYTCSMQVLLNGSALENGSFSVAAPVKNAALEVVNTYEEIPETTSVTAAKIWKDEGYENRRPASVKFELYADGQATGIVKTLTADGASAEDANVWIAVFEDLLKYNAAGEEIAYTVAETEVPDGYLSQPLLDMTGIPSTVAIQNTYQPKPGCLTITKAFELDGAEAPEAVSFTVTGSGEPVTVTLTAEENWTKIIEIADGTYTVKEITETAELPAYTLTAVSDPDDGTVTVPEGGEAKIVFTNTYERILTDIEVYKLWDDEGFESFRPESITFELYVDGAKTDISLTLTAADTDAEFDFAWDGVIEALPKYHGDGTEIVYSLEELPVEGYETEATEMESDEDGLIVFFINTYIPTVEVTVNKVWKDEGKDRPKSIKVQLYRDGALYEEVELSGKNDWTYTWEGLDYEAEWTVDEAKVPEKYVKTVQNEENVWTITNSRVPDTGDRSHVFMWLILAGVSLAGLIGLLFGRKLFRK